MMQGWKMNAITVEIYNVRSGKIVNLFLDMCEKTSVTAEVICTALNEKVSQFLNTSEPWHSYTSAGVSNTSANIGMQKLLKTRIIARNDSIYFSGCPYHIIHNAAQKGGEAFACKSKFDVAEFMIDVYHCFDKYTKLKCSLLSFCKFCDQDYRTIIKQTNTRWLILELAVERILLQYESLKSYFLSKNCAHDRFKSSRDLFVDP